MVIPKEVRAQRLSVRLGAPRGYLFCFVFLSFLGFSRAAQQEEEQLLVCGTRMSYLVCIIRVLLYALHVSFFYILLLEWFTSCSCSTR